METKHQHIGVFPSSKRPSIKVDQNRQLKIYSTELKAFPAKTKVWSWLRLAISFKQTKVSCTSRDIAWWHYTVNISYNVQSIWIVESYVVPFSRDPMVPFIYNLCCYISTSNIQGYSCKFSMFSKKKFTVLYCLLSGCYRKAMCSIYFHQIPSCTSLVLN